MASSVIRVQRKEVDQVALLMNPRANKKTAPNYQQLNYASLKQKQHDNRRQRKDDANPAPVAFKLNFVLAESIKSECVYRALVSSLSSHQTYKLVPLVQAHHHVISLFLNVVILKCSPIRSSSVEPYGS